MTCRLYLLIKVNFKKQCGQDFFSFSRQGHQGQERKKKNLSKVRSQDFENGIHSIILTPNLR